MNTIFSPDQCPSIDGNTCNRPTKVSNNFKSNSSILCCLLDFASSIPDFRRNGKGNLRHKLRDVIILMIFARMSKCVGRVDIITYGKTHLEKFKKMGMLRNGVPSEPTLCRIEKGLDDHAFADKMQDFAEWFQKELVKTLHVMEIICVDGKAERGTVQENQKPQETSRQYKEQSTRYSLYGKDFERSRPTSAKAWLNL